MFQITSEKKILFTSDLVVQFGDIKLLNDSSRGSFFNILFIISEQFISIMYCGNNIPDFTIF